MSSLTPPSSSPSYPDPEELPQQGYYLPIAYSTRENPEDHRPHLRSDTTTNQHELDSPSDGLADPASSYLNVADGMHLDLRSDMRALINAVQRSQELPRYYGAVRICSIVIWEDENPEPGTPDDLLRGAMTLPAGKTAGPERTLPVYTVPMVVFSPAHLDEPDEILLHAKAAVWLHAGLTPAHFRYDLIGVYEDMIDGMSGLVIAVLVHGSLWSSFRNQGRQPPGMSGLFADQVEGMSGDQFDSTILKRCMLDAFAKFGE